jgi:DNA invertase Pin-like site-specific DNA recombinase
VTAAELWPRSLPISETVKPTSSSSEASGRTRAGQFRRNHQGELDYARPGDTLVVPSLDRLGRSLQDLLEIAACLRKRGIGCRSLKEQLDTTTPGGH